MHSCDLEEKQVIGVVEERKPLSQRKEEREREEENHTGDHTRKTLPPKTLTGKTRGPEFLEILQPVGLKDWSCSDPRHGWCGVQGTLQCSCGEGCRKPGGRWHDVRIPWDTLREMVSPFLEYI